MAKNEKTSPSVASKAAKVLADSRHSADVLSVAASALTQAADKKDEGDGKAFKLPVKITVVITVEEAE